MKAVFKSICFTGDFLKIMIERRIMLWAMALCLIDLNGARQIKPMNDIFGF